MYSLSRIHLDALAFLYDNVPDFPAWIGRLSSSQMADLAAVINTWHAKREQGEDIIPLDAIEQQEIMRAIAKFNGDVCSAAKALGVGKTTIYRRLKKWGYPSDAWYRMTQASVLAHKPRKAFQSSTVA